MPDKPSRVRLQLATELRAARTLSGLNQREMATAVGISQALVSRVENGTRLLSRPDTVKWLRAAKATGDVRDRVLALVEAAHTDTQTWGELFGAQRHLQDTARERNAAARMMCDCAPTVIPGLLQTADYARAIIPIADVLGTVDRSAALATRIDRQGVLDEPGKRSFEFLITERLLHWEPRPGVLGPQLAQLLAAVKRPNVQIAVLPDSETAALPWHNFVLRYPDDDSPPYVEVELISGRQDVHDPESVGLYQEVWARLWAASARGDDAETLIRAAIP